MRVYIKKKISTEHCVINHVRCDSCGDFVVKNGKCVSSFWRTLTEEFQDGSGDNETYEVCNKCFSKMFKFRFGGGKKCNQKSS